MFLTASLVLPMVALQVEDEQLQDLLRSLPDNTETYERVVDAVFSLGASRGSNGSASNRPAPGAAVTVTGPAVGQGQSGKPGVPWGVAGGAGAAAGGGEGGAAAGATAAVLEMLDARGNVVHLQDAAGGPLRWGTDSYCKVLTVRLYCSQYIIVLFQGRLHIGCIGTPTA